MGKTKQKQDRSHYLFSNRELANLIGPLVIEQLLAVFVGMADSIMVANVGEAAVSGVSLVDNIMILIINIFAALATGGAVVAGQYIGRKDEKSCAAAGSGHPQLRLVQCPQPERRYRGRCAGHHAAAASLVRHFAGR